MNIVDIKQRVTVDNNHIGQLAGLDGAQVRPPADNFGAGFSRSGNGLDGRHARFHQCSQLMPDGFCMKV